MGGEDWSNRRTTEILRTWTCLRKRKQQQILESLVRESRDEGNTVMLVCYVTSQMYCLTDIVVLCPLVDERKEKSSLPSVSKMPNASATKGSQITAFKPSQILPTPTKTVSGSSTNQTPPANTSPLTTTPVAAPIVSPSPLPVNLANVDLGKISSILSSLSNAMKTTGEFSFCRTDSRSKH